MMASPASNTRSALRELRQTTPSTPDSHSNLNMLQSSPMSSPEEQVIQQRGRKSSMQFKITDFMLLTPPKVTRSPRKVILSTPTRTSPRKRLNMCTLEVPPASAISVLPSPPYTPRSVSASPSKQTRVPKKPKLLVKSSVNKNNVTSALKALSSTQLIDLMHELIEKHPELRDDLTNLIPTPDLQPLEDKLNYLQRNIFKSVPNSRWSSKRDSFCYRRVATHLNAFKKECLDQARQLIDSEQWICVTNYVVMALAYVQQLPDWDNEQHNKSKQMCYKGLCAHLMNAIKKGKVEDVDQLQIICDKLDSISVYTEVAAPCLKYVKELLDKLS